MFLVKNKSNFCPPQNRIIDVESVTKVLHKQRFSEEKFKASINFSKLQRQDN